MNARYLRALLGALALCMTAVGAVAAPQYAVIDLGSSTDPGAGLIWQKRVAQLAAQNWPPTQASCINGLSNWIYAWYGSVAVGTACEPDGTEHAAKWTIDVATQTITLTDLGAPPNPESNAPGSASVYGFNKVGDFVGSASYIWGTSQPCPCFAQHGFIYNNGVWTDLTPIAGAHYDSMAEAVNDSHEVVGQTNTLSSSNDPAVLKRAFVYINGTMYNLTFFEMGGPTALLTDAYWIDCQGNIAAVGSPNSPNDNTVHNYLLVRQGPARTNCPK